MWDLIVSVPDHFLSFYFVLLDATLDPVPILDLILAAILDLSFCSTTVYGIDK